ncbi:MAG: InlB B-repeat-containing protein [Bacilli bacterium]
MNKYFKMAILLLFIFGFSFFVSCNKDKPSDDDGNTPTEKKEYLLVYDTCFTFGSFSDGKTYLEQKYEEGTKVQLIQDEPIRDGYEFAGWINQETKEQVSNPFTINKDTVLEANWVLKKVKITYDAMAGNFEDGSYQKVIYVEQNSPFEYLEIPTNGSRLFNGWYDYETGNYVEEGTIVTQDLTVNAKYRNPGEQYNVNYIINGGTQDLPLVDTYYNQIIYRLSVPTKEGFEFLGWYKSSDFSGEPIKYQTEDCTGDQTYYAKWEIVDANYAEVILDEILPLEIDKDINLPVEYQGASLYWSSSNYDIMTARGKINQTHRNEAVTISVEMTINDELYKFERDVVVKAIAFDELINPVAGYFYRTNVVTKSEALMNNLDIVYYAFANVSSNGAVSIEGVVNFNKLMEEANYLRQNGIRIVLSIARRC